jgi:hypothetical protein
MDRRSGLGDLRATVRATGAILPGAGVQAASSDDAVVGCGGGRGTGHGGTPAMTEDPGGKSGPRGAGREPPTEPPQEQRIRRPGAGRRRLDDHDLAKALGSSDTRRPDFAVALGVQEHAKPSERADSAGSGSWGDQGQGAPVCSGIQPAANRKTWRNTRASAGAGKRQLSQSLGSSTSPIARLASRICSQVARSTGIPEASRRNLVARSGSPAINTGAVTSTGGDDLT